RLDRDRARGLLVLASDALSRRRLPVRCVLVSAVRPPGARLFVGAAARALAVAAVPDDHRCARARLVASRALTVRRAGGARPAVRARGALDVLHDRIGGSRVGAVGGVERDADVAGEQRVARRHPVDLLERMYRKAPRTTEPALVAGALERLEKRVAVAGGAVADVRSLLVAVRPGAPDQLCGREQEILVEVVPGRDDDPRRSGAPLEADLSVRPGQVAKPFSRCAPVARIFRASSLRSSLPSACTMPTSPCGGVRLWYSWP